MSSPALPATYKRIEVAAANADFRIVEAPLPTLADDEVLIRVEACGLCHSDCFVKQGLWPAVTYPRVPGHEVAGVVAAVGSSVKDFSVGDRVGRGWHGGHCFKCDNCKRGNFSFCEKALITGLTTDGGYTQYMACTTETLARLPANLPFEEAGPLMCAGITVFNSLRHCGAIAPALVAVQGIGGLGHLAIQFARKLGFQVVAISTGDSKKKLAIEELGAHYYINSTTQNTVEEIKKLGGARVIIATAFDSAAISAIAPALCMDGVIIQLGADHKPVQLSALQFIGGRHRYQGWPSGQAEDSRETALFASYTGVKTLVETFRLDQVDEAYKAMMDNKCRFRAVIMPNKQ